MPSSRPVRSVHSPQKEPTGDLEDESALVQLFLPGVDAAVAEARFAPGPRSLASIREALGLRVPLLGLSPPPEPEHTQAGLSTPPTVVTLEFGVSYKALIGAAPLIRFTTGVESRPHVCEEGLWLLRQLPAPVHVAVFIGLGRSGKSTTCSALARSAWKEDSHPALVRFTVGHSPKPVTAGADVAALPAAEGKGCLLLIDCEGSDNAAAEKQMHCQILATLAFATASEVSLCDQGLNFKESTLEFLGSALASRQMIKTCEAGRYWPHLSFLMLQSDHAWQPSDLEAALEERDGQDARNETCRAICKAFGEEPCVRSLPRGLTDDAYVVAVSELHHHLCQSAATSSGLPLSGAQLAEVFSHLCNEVFESAGCVAPDSVYGRVVRQHLQLIVDACVEEYQGSLPTLVGYQDEQMLQGIGGSSSAPMLAALERFDSETAHITGPTCAEMLSSMQDRMQKLFNGILSANKGFRDAEERQANSAGAVLVDAFERLLPDRVEGKLICAVTDEAWADLRRWESEQLHAFDAQAAVLCCSEAADVAKGALAAKLTALLEKLQLDEEVMRAAAEATVGTAAAASMTKLSCFPEVQHYDPSLLNSFDTFRKEVLNHFQQEVAACGERGRWEQTLCDSKLRELNVRFDAALTDLQCRNDGLRKSAETTVEAAAAGMLDRLRRNLPELQGYLPKLDERLYKFVDETLGDFNKEVAACSKRGEWENTLCTERYNELQRHFDTTVADVLRSNELLRQLSRRSQVLTLVTIIAVVLAGVLSIMCLRTEADASIFWGSPVSSSNITWPTPLPFERPADQSQSLECSMQSNHSIDDSTQTLEEEPSLLAQPLPHSPSATGADRAELDLNRSKVDADWVDLDLNRSSVDAEGAEEELNSSSLSADSVAEDLNRSSVGDAAGTADPSKMRTAWIQRGSFVDPLLGYANETWSDWSESVVGDGNSSWRDWSRSWSGWRGGAHLRNQLRHAGRHLNTQDAPFLIAAAGIAIWGIKVALGDLL